MRGSHEPLKMPESPHNRPQIRANARRRNRRAKERFEPMKLRNAQPADRVTLDLAIVRLKEARDACTEAGCPKVANKIKTALKSADGARRHMERRLMHSDAGAVTNAGTITP